MKTTHCHLLIGLLVLCAAPALCAAENPRTNTAATSPTATVFTPPLRDAFLAKAEADLRKAAKVSPEFWPARSKGGHPDLKTGLLVAKSPAPAVFAENLDLMRKPEVKYKASDWHPSSLPRIKEDGGVCGRLSSIAEGCRVIMGVPANGIGQPGHRALVVYTYNAKTGRYGCQGMQWIAGVEKSRLLPELGLPLLNNFLQRGAIQAFALVSAVNVGLDRYHDGLIAAHLAMAEANPARKKALFAASAQCNPYQPAVWKELADLAGADAQACVGVLKAMDTLVLNPGSAELSAATELPANTDFSKLPEPAVQKTGEKNYGADFARVIGDALAGEMFSNVLAAKRDLPAAGEAFRAELNRRAAMKIPYGPEVSLALPAKFDMATGKTDEAYRRAVAAIQDADTQKSKKAKTAADAAAVAVVQAVTGPMPPKDAAAWLKDHLVKLEASRPRFTVSDGKPVVETLYAGLHGVYVQTLKRQGGKIGQADAKEAAKALADKLAAPPAETQQSATPPKGPGD